MAERFSAHLKVHRTTLPDDPSRQVSRTTAQKRTEAVDITVRAATLEKLTTKLNAHLALVDEDDFVAEPIKEATRDRD